MGNLYKKIEEAMLAATFAEAGEFDYAREILLSRKSSHKKVLLSTDCPVITGKVLEHALNLCKRMGGSLEVYQLIRFNGEETSPRDYFELGSRRLQTLQAKLNRLGVAYRYAMRETSLEDELREVALHRRDIQAVIIPKCHEGGDNWERFKETVSHLFRCPVVFYER